MTKLQHIQKRYGDKTLKYGENLIKINKIFYKDFLVRNKKKKLLCFMAEFLPHNKKSYPDALEVQREIHLFYNLTCYFSFIKPVYE